MEIIPLKSPIIVEPGDSIPHCFAEVLRRSQHRLRNLDIVTVASKAVAVSEGRIRSLSEVRPSPRAFRLSTRFALSPEVAQVIIDEADHIYGGVRGALLTVKNGEATANAGVDQKNAPHGSVVLWPSDPNRSANRIRSSFVRLFHKKIGIIIVDSRVTPLRLGTIGLALACSGIEPVADLRGSRDLYGRKARITLHAMADDVASAAHLVMGEGAEAVPFAIVRGAPMAFAKRGSIPRMLARECLYMSQISSKPRP